FVIGREFYLVKWKVYPDHMNTWKKTVVPDRFEPELSSYPEHRARHRQTLQRWEAQINSVGGLTKRILVLNRVDLEGPPKNFTYINGYKIFSPKWVEGISVAVGCECTSCLENPVGGCCPGVSGHGFSYDEYGQVKVKPGEVVQKGIQHTLCIFKTDNGRGWGVRTSEHIKRHSFIMEYVGEIITTEEAERRGQVYDRQGATYLFDLDYVEDEYTVDAARYGNLSHINEYTHMSGSPKKANMSVSPKKAHMSVSPKKAHMSVSPKKAHMSVSPKKAHMSVSPKKRVRMECKCEKDNCKGYLF
uniref:Histone-lysine N-methyltransferase n=1 Tax=Oncorhynchus mykiss TaxID=8022 RepID=A0A8C7PL54_ONCMY